MQGETTTPLPMQYVLDWPCEGACLIGYAGWIGDGLETVGEVTEFFCRVCSEADDRLGEPAVVRWLLNAFDDWPRDVMLQNLTGEVSRELNRRGVIGEPHNQERANKS